MSFSSKSILALALAIFVGLLLYQFALQIFTGFTALIGDLLLTLLLSLITYYIFDPVIARLEAVGLSRGIATLLVFLCISCVIVTGIVVVLPSFVEELKNLKQIDVSRYMHETVYLSERLQSSLDRFLPPGMQINISEKISRLTSGLMKSLMNATTAAVPQTLTLALTVPFFSFFFLRDAGEFKRWFMDFVPNRYFETVMDAIYNINRQTGMFIRGKFLESLIIAAATFVVLFPSGIKYNILLSLFAGLCNLIPYVGPVIGAVPIAIIGFADLDPTTVLYVVGAYFIFVQVIVDNMLVIPFVIAKASDLHAFVVLVAIIAGGKFLGIIGMFIGVPVASVLKIIFEEVRGYLLFRNTSPTSE